MSKYANLREGTPSDPEARRRVQLQQLNSSSTGPCSVSQAEAGDRPSAPTTWASRAATGAARSKATPLHRPVTSAATAGWKFDVGDKYVNTESRDRTVILNLRGRNPAATSIETVLAALTANGIEAEDVTAIFKSEDQRQVQLTFSSKPAADSLLKSCRLQVSEHVEASVGPVHSDYHEVRVHWVPDYLQNSFLADVFSRVGKVLSVTKTRDRGGKYGSVRLVKINADWKSMEVVPHTMAIRYQGQIHRLLLTIKGRPPLCLLCSEVGHTRRECPRSPAAVAAREAREFADKMLALRAKNEATDADSDSDDNDEERDASIETSPAPPAAFADAPVSTPPPIESATDTDSAAATAVSPPPNTPPAQTPTTPDVEQSAVAGQFTDSDDSQDASRGEEASTQKTSSWAEEMEEVDLESDVIESGGDEMNSEEGNIDLDDSDMKEKDTPSDSLDLENDIPCAQPEKHAPRLGSANKRKRPADAKPPSKVGRGRASLRL